MKQYNLGTCSNFKDVFFHAVLSHTPVVLSDSSTRLRRDTEVVCKLPLHFFARNSSFAIFSQNHLKSLNSELQVMAETTEEHMAGIMVGF